MVRYTLPVALPVSVLHFVWGLKMSKSEFLSHWQEMTVPEVTDTFSIEGEGEEEGGREEGLVTLLTQSFHLELVQELCVKVEDVQTWTLAGSLETGSLSPQGKQLRVGALIRLEIGGEREGGRKGYRLTVRSVHPTCAMAIFKAVKQQLGG